MVVVSVCDYKSRIYFTIKTIYCIVCTIIYDPLRNVLWIMNVQCTAQRKTLFRDNRFGTGNRKNAYSVFIKIQTLK